MLALPIYNPDIFWHLSAFRRMAESRALPRADWLSWTREGLPWLDFEWLSQLLFGAVFSTGGLAGLWALKVALALAAAAAFLRVLRLYRLPVSLIAAAVALWFAAILPHLDIRPELFSVIGLLLLFGTLEKARLSMSRPRPAALLVLFALWANLHGGFVFGLALLGAYLPEIGILRLAAAGAGTLLTPFGMQLHLMLWRHAGELRAIKPYILEWSPSRWDDLRRLPKLALMAAGAAAALGIARKERPPWRLAALFAALAWASWSHVRFGVYFASIGIPLAFDWGWRAGLKSWPSSRLGAGGATLILAAGLYSAVLGVRAEVFRRLFDPRFVAIGVTEYLASEPELAKLRLHNPWGWGGYLAWRLYPKYKIFQDGRYLFHPLLTEAAEAVRDAGRWQEFLDRHQIEVAIIENYRVMLPAMKRYANGEEKPFPRPHFVFYMPRSSWALVYWDAKALAFVRRKAVDPRWLAAREFRYVRPHDDAAREEALASGEISRRAVEREFARHGEQLTRFAEEAVR